MKNRKKISLGILLGSVMCIVSSPIVTMAESTLSENNTINFYEGITLCRDVYERRYKIVARCLL